MIGGFLYGLYLFFRGILPVWYRLARGLTNRKIAIFAKNDNYTNLKGVLIDSKIFFDKNIYQIDKNSINKAEDTTLMLVHWKSFEKNIDDILGIKKDSDALVIYAPHKDGKIENKDMEKIDSHRNTIVVNFRGRLLNDILVSMITSSYK